MMAEGEMATAIIGCGRELRVGELAVACAQAHTPIETILGIHLHALYPNCGIVRWQDGLIDCKTKLAVDKKLYRILCKDCAVKDGIAW